LVHFSFKRWDLVATILIIFPKINWPNWQILCSLHVCLCFVWRIGEGAWAPSFALAMPLISMRRDQYTKLYELSRALAARLRLNPTTSVCCKFVGQQSRTTSYTTCRRTNLSRLSQPQLSFLLLVVVWATVSALPGCPAIMFSHQYACTCFMAKYNIG